MDLDDTVHLALTYEDGVTRLAETGPVLNDLKQRAGELGIVSDRVEAYVINDLGREHDVHVDFYSVPPGKGNGLERANKGDHPAETRYVFVGAGRRDAAVAEQHGWTYHAFDDVAAEEGWSLDGEAARTDGGRVADRRATGPDDGSAGPEHR